MRNLRRVYQRPDGSLAIVCPAWDDRFSPFGPDMAPVRARYQSLMAASSKDAPMRCTTVRQDHDGWLAMFPFDPFIVSEAEFYEWAVTKGQPRECLALGDVPVVDLPTTREFRECWRHDGVKVHVDPTLETAARWTRIRAERDRRLTESDGKMARATETGFRVGEWKAYRQALRDVPMQTDPKAIVWPDEPAS